MMKRILKLLLAAAVICAVVIAAPASASAQSSAGYEITSYHINAMVSETNVYNVSEVISVHFDSSRHGIYRDIPVNTEETRELADGTRITTRVPSSVWDVDVEGWDYSVQSSGDTVSIKIGDADSYVTGDQTYRISYKIGLGNDGVQDFDEAYFNLIGPDWPTTIDNFTFSVTMPKAFDEDLLGFSTGTLGSTGYDPEHLKFSVDGTTIEGSMLRELSPNEAVTMRLELPQGYFKVPDLRVPDWIMMGAMALLIIISAALFLKLGRDKKPVQTVEFGPPEGLNSAEVGYILDGVVDDRDVVSLIVYWADKGYLSIREYKKGKFELTKLKELDRDAKPFERNMFDGIFKNRSKVTMGQLSNKFYTTFQTVKTMVRMSFAGEERRVFTKKSEHAMPWVTFMGALPFIMTLVLAFERHNLGNIMSIAMGVMIGITLLLPSFYIIKLMRAWRGDKKRVPKLIIGLIFWAALAAVFMVIVNGSVYEPALPWAALASSVLIDLFAVFVRKRTPKGNEWLGKILGLRNFIVTAERDKLLMLVKENPSYFYNVLPYAYVLGITNAWIKNFEGIALPEPQWYTGSSPFTPIIFAAGFNSAMRSFSTNMTSAPASSGRGGFSGGGGGFSGGGFSGGGGGGGGGGAW